MIKIENFIRFNKNNFALLKEYKKLGKVSNEEYRYYKRKPYIKITSKKSYEPEYDVLQVFRLAAAAFFGDSKFSITRLGQLIGFQSLLHASQGHKFSIKTLMKINSKLEEFIKKGSSFSSSKYDFMARLTASQLQEIYRDAQVTLEKYMKTRTIDRPKAWRKENMKAYHVLSLLKRNLGFDILTFTRLEDKIFDKSQKSWKFARHHFRNSVFRKLSLKVQDLVLTDFDTHNIYRRYSEAQILAILEGFSRMMDMKGSGIDGALTKDDVIDIFRNNDWVLSGKDGWFKDLKIFESGLKEFNTRREFLKSQGSDEFIEKYYRSAYNRFYLNFPHGDARNVANGDGFYSLVVPHPWLGDLKMFIDMNLIGYSSIDITNEYWDFFLR